MLLVKPEHTYLMPLQITPYANFTLKYANISASASAKANFCYEWKRRSCTVPRPPIEVKHHPGSLNDLLLKQLIDRAVELDKKRPVVSLAWGVRLSGAVHMHITAPYRRLLRPFSLRT